MLSRRVLTVLLAALFCCAALPAVADSAAPDGDEHPDPFKDLYRDYVPPFLEERGGLRSGYGFIYRDFEPSTEDMRLSSEQMFFTLSQIDLESRADALVRAGIEREEQGLHREAVQIYQEVIDRFPDTMYRVSRYGVYVPVAQYAQRRLLNFPAEGIRYYRTMYDAPAREAFEQARRQYSLIGLSEVADNMMATSYGDRALYELGNAALDRGHYLEALEYFETVRDYFPRSPLRTEELDLRIALCSRRLGREAPDPTAEEGRDGSLSEQQLARLRRLVEEAEHTPPDAQAQRASEPYDSVDDYTQFPSPSDPLALGDPVWREGLHGPGDEFRVFTQPVVTDDSVVYRHRNIVYSRSILTGSLRWKNDLGGRRTWQNRSEDQYPMENLLVQDGLVVTPMHKIGPSLLAIDERTGELRWAHGPIAASTAREARMRFETAPAGGPGLVFAPYVVDNIEGHTHTDSEFGLMALDSTTGRVQWDRTLSRLPPGEFAVRYTARRRNLIRSFLSPPLYHEGTVYLVTNAGVVVALDARSGRTKWLIRYPYFHGVHDATRRFSGVRARKNPYGAPFPMLWFNQRPLIVGERLYITPVDSPLLLCIDRQTGRILWSRLKGWPGGWRGHRSGGYTWMLGPTREGHLVLVHSKRGDIVHLVDGRTGELLWQADPIKPEEQPVMKHPGNLNFWHDGRVPGLGFNVRQFHLGARPFLTDEDELFAAYWIHTGPYGIYPSWCFNLAHLSLGDREVVQYRRYYTPSLQVTARSLIEEAQGMLEEEADYPRDSQGKEERWKMLQEIAGDSVPTNRHGAFLPFSRLTFERYGVLFELRVTARDVMMVYDGAELRQELAGRDDLEAEFAKAELAIDSGRLEEGAERLAECLADLPAEDVGFRSTIKQLQYQVHKRLARGAIRSSDPDAELAQTLGMVRTATTLYNEIEALFAVAGAYTRSSQPAAAARALRSIIETYGHNNYAVPSVFGKDRAAVFDAASEVIERAKPHVDPGQFSEPLVRALELQRRGLPVYYTTVTPLERDLTLRAGDHAIARLLELQEQDDRFAAEFERQALAELDGRSVEEQLHRLWEFPGTPTAQTVLEGQFENASRMPSPDGQQRMWQLADIARVCRLSVPDEYRTRVAAPPAREGLEPLDPSAEPHHIDLTDEAGTSHLVLERRGDRAVHPNLLFIGGRTRMRLDNRFSLTAIDLRTGEIAWQNSEIRLRGTGQEPGFHSAFVYRDLVVVNGLYDVLAFSVEDGSLRWRYRVPFDFEVRHALMSGDLMILAGEIETLALHVTTDSPTGEVVWQEQEEGDLYSPPYFVGDRLVSVRRLPFNVTTRFRATGNLIGRLELPELSLEEAHPLCEGDDDRSFDEALPIAHEDDLLVVTDGWYYIAIDTERMVIQWKRLIDNNDPGTEPRLRFALGGEHLAVVKRDFDARVIYMLCSETGGIRWHTDVQDGSSPQPIYSMHIHGDTLYGFLPHPGQGVYVVGLDCQTGRRLFQHEHDGYSSPPRVRLRGEVYSAVGDGDEGHLLVAEVQDRQDFELRVLDPGRGGRSPAALEKKGTGRFGVHGAVSATVQGGRLVLMSDGEMSY